MTLSTLCGKLTISARRAAVSWNKFVTSWKLGFTSRSQWKAHVGCLTWTGHWKFSWRVKMILWTKLVGFQLLLSTWRTWVRQVAMQMWVAEERKCQRQWKICCLWPSVISYLMSFKKWVHCLTLQKPELVLPCAVSAVDSCLTSLDCMKTEPMPDGMLEKFINECLEK